VAIASMCPPEGGPPPWQRCGARKVLRPVVAVRTRQDRKRQGEKMSKGRVKNEN
jgi:hypothetical protein